MEARGTGTLFTLNTPGGCLRRRPGKPKVKDGPFPHDLILKGGLPDTDEFVASLWK